ncbi:MAG: F0F1 ATP synthase subunit delta [Candidatus Gracilibacteria bacterium]
MAQSVIKDICLFLRKNPDFFPAAAEEKKALLEKDFSLYPALSSYLLAVSEEDFMNDLKNFLHSLLSPNEDSKQNSLLKTFFSFLVQDLPSVLHDFKESTTDSAISASVKEIIHLRSEQEISQAVSKFIGIYTKVPYIVVQTPTHLTYKDKHEIRENMLSKYTYAFPTFAVNKKLIGGMRILVDGRTEDHSWYGRVMNLSHLLYKQA